MNETEQLRAIIEAAYKAKQANATGMLGGKSAAMGSQYPDSLHPAWGQAFDKTQNLKEEEMEALAERMRQQQMMQELLRRRP